jgi:hypothetical protein
VPAAAATAAAAARRRLLPGRAGTAERARVERAVVGAVDDELGEREVALQVDA